jgi:hypothetical protein
MGLHFASAVAEAFGGTLRYTHDDVRMRFAMEIPRTVIG